MKTSLRNFAFLSLAFVAGLAAAATPPATLQVLAPGAVAARCFTITTGTLPVVLNRAGDPATRRAQALTQMTAAGTWMDKAHALGVSNAEVGAQMDAVLKAPDASLAAERDFCVAYASELFSALPQQEQDKQKARAVDLLNKFLTMPQGASARQR